MTFSLPYKSASLLIHPLKVPKHTLASFPQNPISNKSQFLSREVLMLFVAWDPIDM